jgi:ATP-dependent helicase HepA
VLVFSQEAHLVSEFSKYLRTLLASGEVEEFHHLMDEVELNTAALKFQLSSACRVLVSDELGGEGRNFQNATAVLHLDTPWSVSRLEQRIGRLDRVGRNTQHLVQSVVVQGPEATERALISADKYSQWCL